jgi:hypothetical protein
MSKVVFVEMPASGHVNPTLPIAQELVRRGEQVIYYCDDEFRDRIEQAGATFRPYPTGCLTSRDIALATQTGDLLRVPGVILRATHTLQPFMVDELSRLQPDLLVLDSNALWGHMAAKQLGLPTVSLMTTLLLSSALMSRVSLREWLHIVAPALAGIPRMLSIRSQAMRRFGRSAFPKSPVFPARGDLNIAFIPREFQAASPLVDDTFRFVGPTLAREPKAGELPFELPGAGPLVYISLGTLHRGEPDFFRQCFEAFGDMPARFVLSVGEDTDIAALGSIPPNFVVRPSVPQLDVLRHAAAFVTHGGMNSVLEGLSLGVPLLVVPQQIEQLLIALTVVDRGAGIALREPMAGRRIRAAELRLALEKLLAEPRFREAANAARESLRATGGYRGAADEIQAFVARRGG